MSVAGAAELRGMGEEPHNAAILALGRVKRGADALALFEELPSLHPPSLHPPSLHPPSPAASAAVHGDDLAPAPEAVPHHWSWTPAQEAAAPEVAAAQAQAAAAAAAAQEEEAARFGRSTASFNSALIACVECGQLEQASALLRRMRETGVRLNALSYTAGISAAQRLVS